MRKIIKRDGRTTSFDERKIFIAINKASLAVGINDEHKVELITDDVLMTIDEKFKAKVPTVEEVQDIIEDKLVAHNEPEIAKAYILYRAERTKQRDANTTLMKTLRDITFKHAKDNDIKRENANIDGDTAMGTMLKYGSETAKEFYCSQVINPQYSDAHKNGDIHIHDLDFYTLTLTCCQIDLIKLFKDGFSTGNGFIREPNSIRSYASLACIAIQANQNDQHGGQSSPNFDYAMALGVRKSYRKNLRANIAKILGIFDETMNKEKAEEIIAKLEERGLESRMKNVAFNEQLLVEIKAIYKNIDAEKITTKILNAAYDETSEDTLQAMEALIHNLNTMHSRAGAQVPFSSINYGTDVSEEGRMVVSRLLDATIKGLGHGETPIFPIQIFKVKEGVNYNKEDPSYDLLQKAIYTSGLRLFPNFSFLDAPMNRVYYKEGDYNSEVAYMGCRTRVIANVYDKNNEIVSGRGNLSFTSINLPRIAIEHKNMDDFYKRLDEMLDLVKGQMLERLEIQSQKHVYNFPFLMGQGVWLDSDKLKRDDEVRDVIKHGTLSIGFIGLAETLVLLTGKHHGEDENAQKLGLEIIGYLRKKCDEFSVQHKLNFTLLATPAEGLSGRFVKIDRQRFGTIKGVTDREFYTNSFHVPVYYKISIFDKIKKEAPYNYLTNAGHITYVEVDGDMAKNTEAFESIIRCMHEQGIGYGSINHPIDRDPICGYSGIIDDNCPNCGRSEGEDKFERIRRITGYLVGTLDRFNNAKRAEVVARVKHSDK